MKTFAPFLFTASGIFLLCAVYLYLVHPHIGKNPMRSSAFMRHYAHRGLYSAAMPENSLAAFRSAVQHGYGIELDVRLTQDQYPVIFHDDDALRMCGVKKRIDHMTLEEIHSLRLLKTDEPIPALQEVLDLVNGEVPLLIELKTAPQRKCRHSLVDTVLDMLEPYPGSVCLESFDPRLLRRIRRKKASIPRGQLVMKGRSIRFFLLSRMLVLFLSRPHFIACEKHSATTSLKIARLFHPVMISWTIRSAAEWQAVNHRSDLMVFEAFLPQAGVIRNIPRNSERGE